MNTNRFDTLLDALIGYRGETGVEGRTLVVERRTAVAVLLGVHAVALVAIGLEMVGVPVPAQLGVPVILLSLTFVPGGLVVLHVYPDVRLRATHLLYAFGTSLMSLMAIGVVLNLTLPLLGYDTPMARLPLAAAVTTFDLLLGSSLVRNRERRTVSVRLLPLISPVSLSFLLLPLLTILGVELLNRTDSNALLVLALIAVGCVPLAVVGRRISGTWHVLGIWSIALSAVYHKSLWKYTGYGGQPYAIRTWTAKRWTPGVADSDQLTAELLQNGVLYPMYARLTGVHIMTQYSVINPFFVSLLPVTLFLTFRRYTSSRKAFLGASLFVFAHPFFRQYPTAGRSATPVMFLALFGLAISDQRSSRLLTTGFSLLFVLGIVVSHYGTSYYVMVVFVLALAILVALRSVDDIVGKVRSNLQGLIEGPGPRFTLSLVSFYSVATLTWYMYMHGGRKFDLLPKHMKKSYVQLVGGSTFSGRTAARIQRNYGTESIQFSKYLYLLMGMFIALGLGVVLYRRLSNDQTTFDDHYYALAVSMLGIFGATILVRNWGGGRPMMITYTFTTIFAVVGLTAIQERLFRRNREALRVFGTLLAVLFLLNSGVASALVLGGLAPSNVPNQEDLAKSDSPRTQTITFRNTDVATHVWMVTHHEDLRVYGDTFANRQSDWYRPQIIAGTEGMESGWEQINGKPLGLASLARPGVEPGYVLLLGHNQALGGVWKAQYGPQVASTDELELPQRNKVYTTGESAIYYTPINATA